jgi:hypothetical protein
VAAGGVEIVKKNNIIILCALAVVVALLMPHKQLQRRATEAQHANSTDSSRVIVSS